jgi:putrescine importer
VIYIVTAFLMGLVHPNPNFNDIDNAGYEVVALVSGRAFPAIFAVVLIAFTASVMCAQAGSSRLLYAMGRDGVLPKQFAYLEPRFRTPAFNIGLMGVVMLVGEWIDVETAASCVNFGAFTAFLAVNLCVLFDHVGGRRELSGGWIKLLQAAAGAVAAAWLILSLRRTALAVGLLWLCLGVVYWLVRTRGLSRPLAAKSST